MPGADLENAVRDRGPLPEPALVPACLRKDPWQRPALDEIIDHIGDLELNEGGWAPTHVSAPTTLPRSRVSEPVPPSPTPYFPGDSVTAASDGGDPSGWDDDLFVWDEWDEPDEQVTPPSPVAQERQEMPRMSAETLEVFEAAREAREEARAPKMWKRRKPRR